MKSEIDNSEANTKNCVNNFQQQLLLSQDKYERLLHSYNELQKLNHDLEDKLLSVVEKSELDKMRLSDEIDQLIRKLELTQAYAQHLQEESARYKSDCLLAVHMLRCHPSLYVAQRLATLPVYVQELLRKSPTPHMSAALRAKLEREVVVHSKRQMGQMIRVASLPPTGMMAFASNAGDDDDDIEDDNNVAMQRDCSLAQASADASSGILQLGDSNRPGSSQKKRSLRRVSSSSDTDVVELQQSMSSCSTPADATLLLKQLLNNPDYQPPCTVWLCGACARTTQKQTKATQTLLIDNDFAVIEDELLTPGATSGSNVTVGRFSFCTDTADSKIIDDDAFGESPPHSTVCDDDASSSASHFTKPAVHKHRQPSSCSESSVVNLLNTTNSNCGGVDSGQF